MFEYAFDSTPSANPILALRSSKVGRSVGPLTHSLTHSYFVTMASETSPTGAALQQIMNRNGDLPTLQANLKEFFESFFETLGNPKASPSTKGRQKRAVSRLESIHDNITKKTNGAIVVACVLMAYTTLASKLRLD